MATEHPYVRGWRHYDDSPVEPSETSTRPAPFAWYFSTWPMTGTPNDVTVPIVGGLLFLGLGLGFGGFALHHSAPLVGWFLGIGCLPGIGLLLMAGARLGWHRRNPDINPGSYVPIKPPLSRRRPVLVRVLDICLVVACLILAFLFGFTAFSTGADSSPVRARVSVVIISTLLCAVSVLTVMFAVRRIIRRRTRNDPR